ncbi:MAG: DMT family transporter [Pseudomonadales bacterium]|nr:DMT family transporter [Pseudomonadales bacterium]
MPVLLAYAIVVIVWSTTPLGLKWSGEGISPVMGAFARIALAAAGGWVIVKVMRLSIPLNKSAVKTYLYGNIGVSFGLISVYLSAASLSSGLISVMFGLSPIVSALVARFLLPDSKLNVMQWVAVIMGVAGLAIVFQGELHTGTNSELAIGLVLIGVFCFCISGILIKREDVAIHPLTQTVGTLIMAVPIYGVALMLFGVGAGEPTLRAVAAIVYLGLVGSLLGFLCYFYILNKLQPSTVALVTLMTPVFAIMLGAWLNNEALTESLIIGAGCILFGLVMFQWPNREGKPAIAD